MKLSFELLELSDFLWERDEKERGLSDAIFETHILQRLDCMDVSSDLFKLFSFLTR